MYPRLVLPGTDFSVSSYFFLNVAGWFTFLLTANALSGARPDLRRHWLALFVGMGVCFTVGANLLHRFVEGGLDAFTAENLRNRPFQDGYQGGPFLFLLLSVTYFLIRRLAAYPFLDIFAVAFSAAQVPVKLGCFAAGCCVGLPTDSALGLAFHAAWGDPTKRHPTQLYEASFHLVTALLLLSFYKTGRFRGRLVLILGIVYGSWRAAIEALRDGRHSPILGGPLSFEQYLCLFSITLCVSCLLFDASRATSSRRNKVI